jgi:hypothetical protein
VTLASFSELKEVTNRSVQDSAYILFYKLVSPVQSHTKASLSSLPLSSPSPSTASVPVIQAIPSVLSKSPDVIPVSVTSSGGMTVSLAPTPATSVVSTPSLRTRSPLQLEMCPSAPGVVHADNRLFLSELQSTYSDQFHQSMRRAAMIAIYNSMNGHTDRIGWAQLTNARHVSSSMIKCVDHDITSIIPSIICDTSSGLHPVRALRQIAREFEVRESATFRAMASSRAALKERLAAAGHSQLTTLQGSNVARDYVSALYVPCPLQCSKQISMLTLAHHIQHSCSRTPAACRFCGKACTAICMSS